jgi:hypothetical protein
LRLGAAKPAAEFSRYHDAYRELESMLKARIEDLRDLLAGFVEYYNKMEEDLKRVLKENESMRSTIDSTLYDA